MTRWLRTVYIQDLLTTDESTESIKRAATGIIQRLPEAPMAKIFKARDMADSDPDTALLVFNDGLAAFTIGPTIGAFGLVELTPPEPFPNRTPDNCEMKMSKFAEIAAGAFGDAEFSGDPMRDPWADAADAIIEECAKICESHFHGSPNHIVAKAFAEELRLHKSTQDITK